MSEVRDGPDPQPDGRTISDAMEQLEAEGFTAQFGAQPEGLVMCFTCRQKSDAGTVPLHRLSRTEGVSDIADETAIAALTCPHCGARGTVVLTYGPEASEDDAEVLRLLDDRR
jgi:hypothetical protein